MSVTAIAPATPASSGGVQLFASGVAEPRARRPTDVVLAVASSVTLLFCAGMREVGADFERALVDVVDALPGLVEPVWRLAFWLPIGYAVALVVAAVTRGRLAAGTLSAACVHLVAGSPGGRPTVDRMRGALVDLGVDVDELKPAAMQPEGVVLLQGRDRTGPLLVKVYGRDAWDAQLLTTLWRRIWYRESDPATGVRRINLVEHEAFVTLLAERAGASVPRLVTDEPTAVSAARRIIGDERLASTLPLLQEAAMPPLVRATLDDRSIDLDDVRGRLGRDLGAGDQELIRLRRVTWGSVINLVLLVVAAYSLIGLLGGLDLGAFADALGDASWWWLAFAIVLAQLPRIPAAVSTLGACSRPPSLRARVSAVIAEARDALAALRSPSKLLQLFGGYRWLVRHRLL